MKFLAKRDSVQGLVIYYFSLFGFIISCIGISASLDNPLKVTGFILTLAVILIQDYDWIRRSLIHPHDMQLIEKLTDKLQLTKTSLFLKDHDFAHNLFTDDNIAALDEIYYDWSGADYEFVNHRYQRLWLAMRDRLRELMTILHGQAAPGGTETARTANDLAREIYESFQGFRRIYLKNRSIRRQ